MLVNVAGESVSDYVEVTRRLDGVPGVAGIELNISCPNVGRGGLQFAIDASAAGEVTADSIRHGVMSTRTIGIVVRWMSNYDASRTMESPRKWSRRAVPRRQQS